MRIRIIKRKYMKSGKQYVSYSITLPKSIVESLGLEKIEELELEVKEVEGKLAIVLTKP